MWHKDLGIVFRDPQADHLYELISTHHGRPVHQQQSPGIHERDLSR
jgi:hypothetical protein